MQFDRKMFDYYANPGEVAGSSLDSITEYPNPILRASNAEVTEFDSKLAKFKAIETGAPAKIGAEDMHKKTLKAKLHAFEAAAKKEPPVAFKTSWKNVRAGNWQQKKTIAGGVAPKKSIQDWL